MNNTFRRFILFLILASLFVINVRGEESSKKSFSLREAQEYGVKNSYSAVNADHDVKAAKKKVLETVASGLPQVDATMNYIKNFDIMTNVINMNGERIYMKFGTKYSASWGISVSQKIFDGSYIIGVKSSGIYLNISKNLKKKTSIEVRDAIAKAYFMVLASEEYGNILKKSFETNSKTVKETEELFKNGFVEESDLDQVRLINNNIKSQMLKSRREISVARAVLKFTMGINVNSRIELTDDLDGLVRSDIVDEKALESFNTVNHIDYIISENQVTSQKMLYKNEIAQFLPKINAFYNYNKNAMMDKANPFAGDIEWFKSSSAGLNISIPLFSSGSRYAKSAQAKINLKKAVVEKKQTVENLKREKSTLFSDYLFCRDSVKNDRESSVLAERVYKKTFAKFREGIATSTELNQNYSQYLDAQQTYVTSKVNYLNSQTDIEKFLGKNKTK